MKSAIHIDNYAAFRYFNPIERYRIRRVVEAFAALARKEKYYRRALQQFYMAPVQVSFYMCLWLLRTYDLWTAAKPTGYTLQQMIVAVEENRSEFDKKKIWKQAAEQSKNRSILHNQKGGRYAKL